MQAHVMPSWLFSVQSSVRVCLLNHSGMCEAHLDVGARQLNMHSSSGTAEQRQLQQKLKVCALDGACLGSFPFFVAGTGVASHAWVGGQSIGVSRVNHIYSEPFLWAITASSAQFTIETCFASGRFGFSCIQHRTPQLISKQEEAFLRKRPHIVFSHHELG